MAAIRFDVISIGTLSRNRLWNESEPVRTAHATTTLLRAEATRPARSSAARGEGPRGEGAKGATRYWLIDPGLPPPALAARLYERVGLLPRQIDTIFLTNFRPAHRAGLPLFPHARVLIHEREQQAARQRLESLIGQAPEDDVDRGLMERELSLLETFQPAEDQLFPGLDLFPLPGYTPGQCGLLISQPTLTVLIAGDAVPTQDHFLAGQVLPDAHDIPTAQESLREVYEIADVVVPGHDNLFLSPGRGM